MPYKQCRLDTHRVQLILRGLLELLKRTQQHAKHAPVRGKENKPRVSHHLCAATITTVARATYTAVNIFETAISPYGKSGSAQHQRSRETNETNETHFDRVTSASDALRVAESRRAVVAACAMDDCRPCCFVT